MGARGGGGRVGGKMGKMVVEKKTVVVKKMAVAAKMAVRINRRRVHLYRTKVKTAPGGGMIRVVAEEKTTIEVDGKKRIGIAIGIAGELGGIETKIEADVGQVIEEVIAEGGKGENMDEKILGLFLKKKRKHVHENKYVVPETA
jgi:hypothetical protein